MILFIFLKYNIYIGPALKDVYKKHARKTLHTYTFRHVSDRFIWPYFFLSALVAKVTMANHNSNSNIDVGELAANVVNHPDFRQTLTNILQSSSLLNTASSDSNTLATASGGLGARSITGRASESISSFLSTST